MNASATCSNTCKILNLPLALPKLEGLTCLTFLGILLDTHLLKLRSPAEKLARLQLSLRSWAQRKVYTKRNLQSPVGLLHIVFKPGWTFIRRLIDVLKSHLTTALKTHSLD